MNQNTLTLGEAAAELADFLPSGKEAFRLNAASERLLAKGKFKGFTSRAVFVVRGDKQITLPMDFETLIGATLESEPLFIRDNWFEFVKKGPGLHDGAHLPARDLGDGFVTFRDPATATALRLVCDEDETPEEGSPSPSFTLTGRRVEDEGADAEKFTVTGDLTDLSDIAGAVTEVTGFEKPRTKGRVFLESQQPDDSWLRVGCYEARDTKISLRRYSLPTAKEGDAVTAFCKRRFRRASEDSDTLAVDSIYALRMSLEALSYEENGDPDTAAKYWALGVKHLDDSLSEHRGSAGRTVPVFMRASGATKLRALR